MSEQKRYGVDVLVQVRRTYVIEAQDAGAAADAVQALLDTGEYDDTDSTQDWSSGGAEVQFAVPVDDSTPVSLEFEKEAQTAICRYCGRTILLYDVNDGWIDPNATGDDGVWRETCDAHDTFTAEHEPTTGGEDA